MYDMEHDGSSMPFTFFKVLDWQLVFVDDKGAPSNALYF